MVHLVHSKLYLETQKKYVLVNLLDITLRQFKQCYDIFQRNDEFEAMTLTLNTYERSEDETKKE